MVILLQMGNIWVIPKTSGALDPSRSLQAPEVYRVKIGAGKLLAKTTANPVAFWLKILVCCGSKNTAII